MAEKRPILFLSDAVSGSSGLSRIARDLSTRVHEHLGDLYRVASFGYGSPGSSKIPFQQFVIEGMSEWVMPTLPDVCADFFGKEKGIICTVFDAHRLTWLADVYKRQRMVCYRPFRASKLLGYLVIAHTI